MGRLDIDERCLARVWHRAFFRKPFGVCMGEHERRLGQFRSTWIGTDYFRILSNGSVGINTHTPAGYLEIDNNGVNRSTLVLRGYGNSLGWGIEMHPANDTSPTAIAFFNAGGGVVGNIQTTSSNTSYLTSSD